MDETFDDFLQLCAAQTQEPLVLATLVGGTPTGSLGRRAWFLPSGEIRGSVTLGGCAEGKLKREAAALSAGGKAHVLSVELGSSEAYEFGMTCGGRAEVLLQRLSPADPAWRAAAQARAAGLPVRLETSLTTGITRFVPVPAGASAQAQRDGDFFYETWPVPLHLLIVGSGPVARPLSRLSATLGLRVSLTDDHPQRVTPQLFPDVHTFYLVEGGQELTLPPLGEQSAVVIVSHDYAHEVSVLSRVLPLPVRYVALLASRRRGAAVLDFMAQIGVPAEQLARVRTPAGVDLGLSSPAGIALSILSELAQVLGGGSGEPLGQHRAVN